MLVTSNGRFFSTEVQIQFDIMITLSGWCPPCWHDDVISVSPRALSRSLSLSLSFRSINDWVCVYLEGGLLYRVCVCVYMCPICWAVVGQEVVSASRDS